MMKWDNKTISKEDMEWIRKILDIPESSVNEDDDYWYIDIRKFE